MENSTGSPLLLHWKGLNGPEIADEMSAYLKTKSARWNYQLRIHKIELTCLQLAFVNMVISIALYVFFDRPFSSEIRFDSKFVWYMVLSFLSCVSILILVPFFLSRKGMKQRLDNLILLGEEAIRPLEDMHIHIATDHQAAGKLFDEFMTSLALAMSILINNARSTEDKGRSTSCLQVYDLLNRKIKHFSEVGKEFGLGKPWVQYFPKQP